MYLRVKSLKSFAELVRLEHGVMYGAGVVIGAILAGGVQSLSAAVLIGFLVAMLAEFGAFALNDYFDIDTDIANRRKDRPLVRKEVSLDVAMLTTVTSFLLANILAFLLLNITAFAVVFLLSIISMLYNISLKHMPLIGNLFIAVTMAVPFVFGGIIVGALSQSVLFLSAIAFTVGVGREIMKDIEDMPGDAKHGANTLPISIGKRNAAMVAILFYLASVVLSVIPMFTFFSAKPLYTVVLVTDTVLLYVCYQLWRDQSLKTLRFGRKWSFFAVAIGLVAFLLASL